MSDPTHCAGCASWIEPEYLRREPCPGAALSTTPASLDVERLARAIKARSDIAPHRPSQESFGMVDLLDYADAIAAEYAALEGAPHE